MVKTEAQRGGKLLFPKTVDKFPSVFKSATRRANIAKATDWWRKWEGYLDAARGTTVVSGRRAHGRVRVNRKSATSRGRYTSTWVTWLYPVLLDEFDRLQKAGLKFDTPLLCPLVLKQFSVPSDPYTASSVDSQGSLITTKVTTRLDENAVENVNETHFVIDFDDGKTLGFVAKKQVKYADAVSGGQGMTMVARISSGASGYIHPPMMIFTNADRCYPIRGVKGDVDGVCYRIGPKGWMDKALDREYLKEPRAICADPRGRPNTVFLDNCSGHLKEEESQEELQRLNARLIYLPANATDLCQPADSLVIAKIKDVWARMWNNKKIELIEDKEGQTRYEKTAATMES
ncbi:hypothetical protein PC110_g8850 [Phytophthora cactorum]|uniref:DDE-1 domain-containing protein n=1 Tax=Phytophthora cactorum TaxID=29920 RepID=A0A329SDJ7_9STRA|nr:hypothetical protein PC110_g8850 [Phytophthora cactorum]